MRKSFFYIIILFSILNFAQNVETTINKSTAKIGQEVILSIKVPSFSSDAFVFPKLDSIGKLEVINDYPIEYKKQNNASFTIKKYGLTQFDKGIYEVPSIDFQHNAQKKSTDLQKVEFKDVAVDTTKQKMFDIKPSTYLDPTLLRGNLPKLEYWHFGVLFISIIALALLGRFLLKKFKFNKIFNQEAYIPPFEKFQNGMQVLSFNNAKDFYSNLTDQTRTYLSKTLEISTLEKTTQILFQDISQVIKEKKLAISKEVISQLEKVFKNADLVKFAKSTADQVQMEQDLEATKSSMHQIKNIIPQTAEEQNEIVKEKIRFAKVKLEKKKLSFSTYLIGLISLIVGIFILGTSNIYEFLSFHFFTKDAGFYVEKQWISSTYGYPALQMETPEALERKMDTLNPKIIQIFNWQKTKDELSVELIVIQKKNDSLTKNNININFLKQAFSPNFNFNPKMKVEEFSTIKKVSGQKAIGTFEFKDKDQSFEKRFVVYSIIEPQGQFIIKLTFDPNDSEYLNYIEKIENGLEIIDISPFENENNE